VVVVVGSDPGRTAKRASALGVDRWSVDAAAVIADPAIDVIHICTPNATHVALASAALANGKHVVLEKPIAMDVAGANALVDRAASSGRHAMVALTYRGYPMVRRARQLVASGELGAVRVIHGGYIQDWLADETAFNWRIDPQIGGTSRAVADIGTHWFDTIEFISGRRVEAVMANLATLIPSRLRPVNEVAAFGTSSGPSERVEIHSEDAATILVRFEGGAIGACVISQVSAGRKNAFTVFVDGATSSLSWEQEMPEHLWIRARDQTRLLVRDPGGDQPASGIPSLPAGHPEGWGEALRDLIRPFYAAIAEGASPTQVDAPYPTLFDGARSLAFVDAVLASAQQEAWVRLDPGDGARPHA
jgi:predicted dehydrogenase